MGKVHENNGREYMEALQERARSRRAKTKVATEICDAGVEPVNIAGVVELAWSSARKSTDEGKRTQGGAQAH